MKLKELLQEANENYLLLFDKQLGVYTIKFSNGNVIIWDFPTNNFRLGSFISKRPYLVGNNKSKDGLIRMNKVEVISYLKLNGVN